LCLIGHKDHDEVTETLAKRRTDILWYRPWRMSTLWCVRDPGALYLTQTR